ncbi:MAG TPA: fibronectin type III-like domain-contianing protein [Microbacterium sp.]|uniref:fibronectin type III-like domain-contianing protein n=1 Tax=Microbacterium sp. TaxID=51671 RepID=UPI002B4A595E|nr:fibronectin type III-like domain-contianing protein [Microbacterium sp.]HKT56582.1 fibronectin type III-like domain-contianing protein [Microbacterium sp.]
MPSRPATRIEFALSAGDLTIVDAEGRRVVEPGEFELHVERSSRSRDLIGSSFVITE